MRAAVLRRSCSYICSSCQQVIRPRRRGFATARSPTPEIYDVVCVGGGPVGLSLLAALKASPITRNLKIALIETQDLTKQQKWTLPPDRYSNRASSLTPSSTAFLQDIGAWQHIDHTRIQPYDEMQVWDGNTDARITFDWAQAAQPGRTIATMAENANLTQALLTRLSELSNTPLSIFQNTTVSNIANGTDTPDADLSSWPVLTISATSPSSSTQPPPSIAARLLIGADGVNSPVRKYAGISTRGWDYDRHGVVATLTTTRSDDAPFKPTTTAYQRFLPALGGPVALLPFPQGHASLVWSTTPQNAAYLKSLPAEAFTAMVNAALRLSQADLKYMLTLPPAAGPSEQSHASELSWRLQHTPPSPATSLPWVASLQPHTLASFPLRHLHATTYTNPRVALAGDAAHTVHPLAGQGLNLGLGDAKALAATIAEAVEVGADIGDVMALEKYGRERWGVNALVGGVCDGLHKLYSHDGGVFTWGRTLGLGIVENVPGLKGLIMGAAEGR